MDDDNLTRLAVPVGPDDHIRGNPDAPVTMVEYGDFECPYCKLAYPRVRALEARFGDRLRVVFRSFPLQQHPHAEAAAEVAELAADRGVFWQFHDAIYERDYPLDEPHLIAVAERLGISAADVTNALEEGVYRPIVEEMKEGGEESGIPGTPAFFLNDVLFEDEPTLENLSHAVEWLLEHGSAA
jgi:protein-disulfide isomerase